MSQDWQRFSYAYDAAGNRTELHYPGSDNFWIKYEYDIFNRMTAVKHQGATTLAGYSGACPRGGRRPSPGNRLSRRTGLDYAAHAKDVSYSYENDNDLDVLNHANVVSFDHGYNAVHQLTSNVVSVASYRWTPTYAENLSYAPNNLNQYTSVSGQSGMFGTARRSLTHDANGNLTSDGRWTYGLLIGPQSPGARLRSLGSRAMMRGGRSALPRPAASENSENRLLAANDNGTGVATYAYDPLGRRRSKNVTGEGTTTYLLDGDEEIGEYNGSTLVIRYVYGPAIDERVAVDTFFAGTLKGVGKVYLQSVIDCFSRYAWGGFIPQSCR